MLHAEPEGEEGGLYVRGGLGLTSAMLFQPRGNAQAFGFNASGAVGGALRRGLGVGAGLRLGFLPLLVADQVGASSGSGDGGRGWPLWVDLGVFAEVSYRIPARDLFLVAGLGVDFVVPSSSTEAGLAARIGFRTGRASGRTELGLGFDLAYLHWFIDRYPMDAILFSLEGSLSFLGGRRRTPDRAPDPAPPETARSLLERLAPSEAAELRARCFRAPLPREVRRALWSASRRGGSSRRAVELCLALRDHVHARLCLERLDECRVSIAAAREADGMTRGASPAARPADPGAPLRRMLVAKLKISPPYLSGYASTTDDPFDGLATLYDIGLALQIARYVQVELNVAGLRLESPTLPVRTLIGVRAGPELPLLNRVDARGRGWQLQLPFLIGYRHGSSSSEGGTSSARTWRGEALTFDLELELTYWFLGHLGVNARFLFGVLHFLESRSTAIDVHGDTIAYETGGTFIKLGFSTGLSF
jgi:hypothetical protein